LFKDGLGAAYVMGKAVAKTALLYGIGRRHFERHYRPAHKKCKILTKGMLGVVAKEQATPERPKRLSSILWDVFTGNERYKNIFYRSLSGPLVVDLLREYGRSGRGSI